MFKKFYTKLILAILIINAVLVLVPAILFDLPVAQTDGATHYVYAKVYSETFSLESENPKYNKIGSAEEKISDYPPMGTVFFGLMLKIFGNDIFQINGGFGLIFFLLASIFMYLFLKELTKNNIISLIGLSFFVLNLRAYYTLFTGIYPAFIAFCLSIPALYFSLKFFGKGSFKDLIILIVLNFIILFAYTPQGLFLVLLEIMLWIGLELEERIDVRFPKFAIKVKKIKTDYKRFLYFLIPVFLILSISVSEFILTESSVRPAFVSEWISSLLKPCPGYPCFWENFLITDGPIFVFLAIIGSIYLFYKKKWTAVSLLLVALLLISSDALFNLGPGFVHRLYRFHTMFFALMIIPVSIFFHKLISDKNTRAFGILLLMACLLIQAGKLGYFYTWVTPAISHDEFLASQELLKYKTSDILYVNNEIEEGVFKSFKWIVVYAKSENYELENTVPEDLYDFDYIFVDNGDKLSEREKESVHNLNLIFEKGKVQIYKV